jgi:hypothetical protein
MTASLAAPLAFFGAFFGAFVGAQAAAADDSITIQHVVLRDGRVLDGIQHGRVFDCYDLASGHMIGTITKVYPEDIVTSEDETIHVLPAGAVTATAADAAAPATGASATGHGLGGKWGTSYKAALASAKRTGRPLLILFTFDDAPGKSFDDDIGQDPGFKDWAKDRLVLLRIDLGKDQLPLLKTQDDDLVRVHHVTEHPQLVVCNQDGKELLRSSYHGNGADAWLPIFRIQVDTAAPPPLADSLPNPEKSPVPAIPASPVVAQPAAPAAPAVTVPPKSIPPAAPAPVANAPIPVAPAPVAPPVVTPPPVSTPPVAVQPAPTPVAPTPVAAPPITPTPVTAPPPAPAPVAASPAPLPAPAPTQPPPPPPAADDLTPLTVAQNPAPTVPAALIGTWVPDPAVLSADPLRNIKQLASGLTLTITATSVTYAVADQIDPDVTHQFAILAVTPDTVILRAFLHRGVDSLERLGFAYRDGRIYLPCPGQTGPQKPTMLVLIPKP